MGRAPWTKICIIIIILMDKKKTHKTLNITVLLTWVRDERIKLVQDCCDNLMAEVVVTGVYATEKELFYMLQ